MKTRPKKYAKKTTKIKPKQCPKCSKWYNKLFADTYCPHCLFEVN